MTPYPPKNYHCVLTGTQNLIWSVNSLYLQYLEQIMHTDSSTLQPRLGWPFYPSPSINIYPSLYLHLYLSLPLYISISIFLTLFLSPPLLSQIFTEFLTEFYESCWNWKLSFLNLNIKENITISFHHRPTKDFLVSLVQLLVAARVVSNRK